MAIPSIDVAFVVERAKQREYRRAFRYFCGNATFGAAVKGSMPNFGYASVG